MPKLAIALMTSVLLCALDRVPVAADPSPAPSAEAEAAAKSTTTASGLEYIDETVGTGPTPKIGQTVTIQYAIRIGDTKIAASTLGAPMIFTLGKGQALKGLEEGVSTMKKGGKRKLLVPPSLGYGSEPVPKVPPNSTLFIDVELLDIT